MEVRICALNLLRMMKHVVPPIAAVDREEITKETELPGKQKILS